jgi:probable HAF family extracellular repeat protein
VGQASGLNDFGQIAVTDVTGTVSGIYQNGRFTPLLTPPAGFLVNAYGINNAGTIVGTASTTTDAHLQAFILQRGKYRFFFRSGWQNTAARAVGPSGLVVGISYQDDQNTWAGFAYDPATGAFTDVTPPGSIYTIVQGVNRFGRIAGSGQDDSGRYAFIWQQSASANRALVPFLERINVADGFANARGINDEGVITGWAHSGGLAVGFVGSASRGYQLLVPPGGNAPNLSYCQGINNARQVSCIVTDANSNPLGGFLGSPTEN